MKRINSQNKNKVLRILKIIPLSIGMWLFLYGCGLFQSPYSVVSYENFTTLKALHLKFIDDFTYGPGKSYDQNKIDEMYNMGDFMFRAALEYEMQKDKDQNRIDAFNLLYTQFIADHLFLIESNQFFSAVFASELRSEVEQNYNLAIKGELSRRDASNN